MKLFISILVSVTSHLSLAADIAVPLRMISDGTHTVACIERKEQEGDDEYEIRICRTDGQTHTQERVSIESPFQFTKGFCSDNFVALTNTGTDETPAMCVFDLANNTVVVAEARFDITKDSISTCRISEHSLTSEGCIWREFREWHRDDWTAGKSVLYLRLGDSIPNRCPVQWKYDAGNQLFEVRKSQGSGATVRYEVRQYPVQKKRHSKVIFRAETE